MKIKTGLLAIFLFIGLLGVPNCIFAQPFEDSVSFTIINGNSDSNLFLNGLTPLLKGSSGGGGKSSGSSASKSVKKADGSDDNSNDDGSGGWGWLTLLIIGIVVLGIIGVLVWYFVLRNR